MHSLEGTAAVAAVVAVAVVAAANADSNRTPSVY